MCCAGLEAKAHYAQDMHTQQGAASLYRHSYKLWHRINRHRIKSQDQTLNEGTCMFIRSSVLVICCLLAMLASARGCLLHLLLPHCLPRKVLCQTRT